MDTLQNGKTAKRQNAKMSLSSPPIFADHCVSFLQSNQIHTQTIALPNSPRGAGQLIPLKRFYGRGLSAVSTRSSSLRLQLFFPHMMF